MTESERVYNVRLRALLIEQEKALTELRAAVIGQRRALETLIASTEKIVEAHEPSEGETLRTPFTP